MMWTNFGKIPVSMLQNIIRPRRKRGITAPASGFIVTFFNISNGVWTTLREIPVKMLLKVIPIRKQRVTDFSRGFMITFVHFNNDVDKFWQNTSFDAPKYYSSASKTWDNRPGKRIYSHFFQY